MLPPEPERFDRAVFPDPALVRRRLADNLHEAQFLRRLLRVVEDVSQHKSKRASQSRQEQGAAT
jgi:hypothetical protein